jgi:hypothetical protein
LENRVGARRGGEGDVAAGRRGAGGHRGVEAGVAVLHAEAVRADEAHPAAAGGVDHGLLESGAVRAGLGEAAGDEHRRSDSGRGGVGGDVGDGGGRHDDHGEVDAAGDVGQSRVRLAAGDRVGRRRDGDDVAGEPRQVGHERRAHPAGFVGSADDGDAPGVEDELER